MSSETTAAGPNRSASANGTAKIDRPATQYCALAGCLLLCIVIGCLAGRFEWQQHRSAGGPREATMPLLQLDLNVATEAELALLPGIGPVSAARILADRKRNGPFLSVEDFVRVPGIGPKTLDKCRPFLLVK